MKRRSNGVVESGVIEVRSGQHITSVLQYSIPRRQLTFVCLTLCAMLFALCASLRRSRPEKIPRIGFLDEALLLVARRSWRRSARSCASLDGSRERISPSSIGLPSKRHERLPELAADLVRLKVDLIVAYGGPSAFAAEESNHYHTHRDGERWRIPWVRFGRQSGAAGRQCHRCYRVCQSS